MGLPAEQKKQQRDFAKRLMREIPYEHQVIVSSWFQDLIDIKNSDVSKRQKVKSIFQATKKRKIIFPTIKLISKKVKQYAWDDRKAKGRIGIVGIGIGVTFFAGQSAGIAALGGAVGVPLWVVFGAGGTFAGFCIEEYERVKKNKDTVVDVEYEDVSHDEIRAEKVSK